MSYQVIARKWRPQRFDDVVGQLAVTRTLRNALTSGRIAQAFVFGGPRGVGKTTTARILARALSCTNGPTPDPCGTCEACVEIAEGRDIDVLEIDAATHTGIDNIREVIISGLAIRPVRNRYKIFIIDEVHQLSPASFNSLLKSIEEPPPHVVFMMATTEVEKIPETVRSRSQVYEFRTISTQAIADQLRRIVDAEQISVGDDALQLIARDADGSMRDGQSKLDQVLAFTGKTIATEDVSTVLGLVGRDLLLDTVRAVADEDAPASFALAARAVDLGYDLRLVCRELSRVVRDLLILNVDPSRASDPEIAGEAERETVLALAARFSREDLLRAFDLLTRAEFDIRAAAQPRYHLEMALLRWMHLRKLMPIEELIAGAGSAGRHQPEKTGPQRSASASLSPAASKPAPLAPPATRFSSGNESSASVVPRAQTVDAPPSRPAPPPARPVALTPSPVSPAPVESRADFKDAFLAEIRKSKHVFYNAVVVQAQKIEVAADRVTFSFSSSQRALRDNCEQNRVWLEAAAQKISGRRIAVTAVMPETSAASSIGALPIDATGAKKIELREQALADAGVQALLEVFPAEIRDVEEM
ncbi:MAG: DNA polymerase III subunit gamma/tau [Acidobacteriota bacterium]